MVVVDDDTSTITGFTCPPTIYFNFVTKCDKCCVCEVIYEMLPVRRSNQLSYEATVSGCHSSVIAS